MPTVVAALPLWHIDAVTGGGVHPIAYTLVRLSRGTVAIRYVEGTDMTAEPGDIPPDDRRIDLNDMLDVRSWMFSLGCREAELRLAVRDAGDRAEDVRAYLFRRK